MDDYELGNRLKELRTKDGLTLDEVAQEVGITPAHLSAIENEKIPNPGYRVVVALARFYGLSTSSLLGETAHTNESIEIERIATRLRTEFDPEEIDLFSSLVQVHLQRKRDLRTKRSKEQHAALATLVRERPRGWKKN
jgi:transcriptional regulator with XRE-family HTH domain